MCANWQSHFASRNQRVSLAGFSAEAGKTYYFRVRVTSQGQHEPPLIDLEQINRDEGMLLVASAPLSVYKQKDSTTP
jgi:hypothetical protein